MLPIYFQRISLGCSSDGIWILFMPKYVSFYSAYNLFAAKFQNSAKQAPWKHLLRAYFKKFQTAIDAYLSDDKSAFM